MRDKGRLKILLLISALDCGGAESHVVDLARGLSSLGHSVTVASAGGKMAEGLEGCGVRHVRLYLNGRDPVRLLFSYLRLVRLVRREDFDLIHAHSRIAAFFADMIAKRRGVPLVTTVHARFSTAWYLRGLSRWGNVSIAVSEDLRHYLCKSYGVSAENTRLILNGVDTGRFAPPTEGERKDEQEKNIVFISRLDSDCSAVAIALCQGYERLSAAIPNLRVTICGGGDMLPAIREIAEGKDGIRLVGRVERTEEILADADLFIGVSRAAMEAMSCGVPTILGGDEGYFGILRCREELEEASLGNFCCRGMSRLVSERLLQDVEEALSMDGERRRELSKLLSEYIRENNSAERMAELTEEVYFEAVGDKKNKRGGVLLCGYYGFGNMGDNALLRAAISLSQKRFSGMEICALTRTPKRDGGEFNVRCIDRYSPFAIYRELSRASVLVLGGGTLLQEDTSLRSLIYYVAVIRAAARMGVAVELWGNGLGEARSDLSRRLLTGALRSCRRVGLRDGFSLSQYLRLMGKDDPSDKLYYEPDLALSQRRAEPSRVEYLLSLFGLKKKDAPKGYAVVAVRGASGRGFLNILANWLVTLRAEGIKLLFVPMFPREDYAESQRLCRSLGGVVAEAVTESDLVGLMGGSEVVLGMRLHSLIFASVAEAPFVGFGADPKIERFCRENGGLYFTDLYR